MIFRNKDGSLIEINKHISKNDTEYYKIISNLMINLYEINTQTIQTDVMDESVNKPITCYSSEVINKLLNTYKE
jgi:hypothetical protein